MDKNIEIFFKEVENETRELKNDYFEKLNTKIQDMFDDITDDLKYKLKEITNDNIESLNNQVDEYIKLKDNIQVDVKQTNEAIATGFQEIKFSVMDNLQKATTTQNELITTQTDTFNDFQKSINNSMEAINESKTALVQVYDEIKNLSKQNSKNNRRFYISLTLNLITIALLIVTLFI